MADRHAKTVRVDDWQSRRRHPRQLRSAEHDRQRSRGRHEVTTAHAKRPECPPTGLPSSASTPRPRSCETLADHARRQVEYERAGVPRRSWTHIVQSNAGGPPWASSLSDRGKRHRPPGTVCAHRPRSQVSCSLRAARHRTPASPPPRHVIRHQTRRNSRHRQPCRRPRHRTSRPRRPPQRQHRLQRRQRRSRYRRSVSWQVSSPRATDSDRSSHQRSTMGETPRVSSPTSSGIRGEMRRRRGPARATTSRRVRRWPKAPRSPSPSSRST